FFFRIVLQTNNVHSLTLLMFNCSFVPMMVMCVIACYFPQQFSQQSSTAYYMGFIALSDVVPLIFAIVNVLLSPLYQSSHSLGYAIAAFLLYVTQLTLTAIALFTLYKKSTSNVAGSAVRKNLVRFMLFSLGPCLIQIPFAVCLVTKQLFWHNITNATLAFYIRTNMIVDLLFAIKPTIDVLFTLLFLGEYRQQVASSYKRIRGVFSKSFPQNTSLAASKKRRSTVSTITVVQPMTRARRSTMFI
ncbi:hypothetical protein AAVH_14760, partial [Aphelenchoides avenae]